MNRKLVCLGSLVFFSLTLGLQSHLYAADNEVGIPFSPKSYEMTSESSLIDFIESHKADEKIGFEISDRSANLKTSSLEYITEKNRTLRVYQTILKSGVKPSRISISTASSKSNNVSIFAKEGIDSPIAQLPAASESDQNENSFKILFDSASAVPKFSSNDELAKFLSGFGKGNRDAVVLEGRTDSVGNANYNRALAELRALSVFKLLVDNGLPPYRVDTKAVAQSSNPGKGKASADDRAVVVKWTENKAIAAEAAVIEKPVEVEQPPVVAPVEPAPVVESKPVAKVEESPKSESSLGTIDLVVAAGALIPGGELSKHAKTSASWGLGVGKAFWAEQGREVRGTILYHGNATLKAKESALDGPLHISSYTARLDYVFGGDIVRPFVGLGAGAFKWDGSIVQKASAIKHTGGKSDGAGLAALGLDIYLAEQLILAPELTFYNVGGHFSEKLYAADITLRWRLK